MSFVKTMDKAIMACDAEKTVEVDYEDKNGNSKVMKVNVPADIVARGDRAIYNYLEDYCEGKGYEFIGY